MIRSIENEKDIPDGEIASTGKMISWSFGDIPAYYLEAAYAVFIFFFYEVEVGLSVIYVGLGLVIFAIWNMVNDPLVGYLTDRPFKWTAKWGMRFPWIMIAVFPTLIFYLLVYIPPDVDPKTNPLPIFLYMVIILCLFDLFYSLFTAHFYGSFANHFRNDYERRKASFFDQIIPGLGNFGLSLIPPLFIVYGVKSSYVIAILILVVIMAICVIISIPGVRESEELKEIFIQGYEKAEKLSYFKVMKIAFNKKNFNVLLLTYTLFMAGYLLIFASQLYYFKDVLELPYSYAIISSIALYAGFLISISIWSVIAKRIGHAQTFTIGLFLSSVTLIPFLWLTTFDEFLIVNFIAGFGFGAFWFMFMAVMADVNDEVSLAIGKRQDATLVGIRTFFYRSAFIVQAIVITVVHLLTGYNPDPFAKQTPLAVWGVRIHMALIPAIFIFIGFLIFLIWYDLKDKKKEQIFAQLREKGLK